MALSVVLGCLPTVITGPHSEARMSGATPNQAMACQLWPADTNTGARVLKSTQNSLHAYISVSHAVCCVLFRTSLRSFPSSKLSKERTHGACSS
jgi:hypothetical protein